MNDPREYTKLIRIEFSTDLILGHTFVLWFQDLKTGGDNIRSTGLINPVFAWDEKSIEELLEVSLFSASRKVHARLEEIITTPIVVWRLGGSPDAGCDFKLTYYDDDGNARSM